MGMQWRRRSGSGGALTTTNALGMRCARRTAVCRARITTIRPSSLDGATWAQARADQICAAHVPCNGGAPVKLLMKIQGGGGVPRRHAGG